MDVSHAALGGVATLRLGADWSTTVEGSLVVGSTLRVDYAPERLASCRGDFNGGPGWTIEGSYRVNGGDVKSFHVAGHSPTPSHEPAAIKLDTAGKLELWFHNTSRWGCSAYDSAFGSNYALTIKPNENAPDWIGNAASAFERQTCGGSYCEGSQRPLGAGFTYDSWARQRAAVRVVTFEAYKPGTTDFDNSDLWQQLDVRMYYRFDASAPFAMKYVSFDRRSGNNARYAADLRATDPFDYAFENGKYANQITDKTKCPPFPLTTSGESPGASYVEAKMSFHFTVNGSELRPEGGGEFVGTYQSYANTYAVCLAP